MAKIKRKKVKVHEMHTVSVGQGEAPRCPVCACAQPVPSKSCARCETLYHEDCLEFVGQCSVYGCVKVEPKKAGRTRRGHRWTAVDWVIVMVLGLIAAGVLNMLLDIIEQPGHSRSRISIEQRYGDDGEDW